jgi:hypothetical protein
MVAAQMWLLANGLEQAADVAFARRASPDLALQGTVPRSTIVSLASVVAVLVLSAQRLVRVQTIAHARQVSLAMALSALPLIHVSWAQVAAM